MTENIKQAKPGKYYVDLDQRKHFKEPIFTVTKVVTVNDAEVDAFVERNRRLPDHVYLAEGHDDSSD